MENLWASMTQVRDVTHRSFVFLLMRLDILQTYCMPSKLIAPESLYNNIYQLFPYMLAGLSVIPEQFS
jgi:hypothetical protein